MRTIMVRWRWSVQRRSAAAQGNASLYRPHDIDRDGFGSGECFSRIIQYVHLQCVLAAEYVGELPAATLVGFALRRAVDHELQSLVGTECRPDRGADGKIARPHGDGRFVGGGGYANFPGGRGLFRLLGLNDAVDLRWRRCRIGSL